MPDPVVTQLQTFNINKLTKEQYDSIVPNPTDFYLITDDPLGLKAGNGITITHGDTISIEDGVILNCGTSNTVV